MFSFQGFPDNSRFTPVPNLLFGPLLEEIEDHRVLRCLLRVLWLYAQKKGSPRFLSWEELLADPTLSRVVSSAGVSAAVGLEETLAKTVATGALLRVGGGVYVPNTEEGRRAASHLSARMDGEAASDDGEPLAAPVSKPNIFGLYEDNIGLITPIMADELREAEELYPQAWVEEAFREAVTRNKRSWRYVEAILKGWAAEGRGHGESGGHTKKADSRDWIRRHGLPRPSR